MRKGADLAPFSRYPNVKGLIVDVTNEEQIHAAIATVEAECPEGLYALVNNAGKKETCQLLKMKQHSTHSCGISFSLLLYFCSSLSSLTGYEQYGTTDWCGLDYFKLYVPSSPSFPSLFPPPLLTHPL